MGRRTDAYSQGQRGLQVGLQGEGVPLAQGRRAASSRSLRARIPQKEGLMSTDEAPAKPKGPEKVRSTLGRVIRDAFDEDYLREFAQSIKSMSMGAWGYGVCPECGSPKKGAGRVPGTTGA